MEANKRVVDVVCGSHVVDQPCLTVGDIPARLEGLIAQRFHSPASIAPVTTRDWNVDDGTERRI